MADETTQLLERHFDTAFDAPNGIEKLRELILTLATQGKLVSQDSVDEPASELIQFNRELIEQAIEGKQKSIPKLPNTQKSSPHGWARCQLADVALVVMGNSPPGNTYNDYGDGVPLINGPVEFSRDPFGPTIKSKYTTAPSRLCRKGDLLVCVRGATTGRTNIAAFDACIGRGVALVRGWSSQNYLNYVLLQLGQQLLEQGKGTTFPSISYADLAGLEIWLPPLPEQRRIVAKIDQLMTRCDELEKLRTERDRKRLTVHTAALDRLLTTQTSDSFTDTWQSIMQHFGELYSVKENVAELRKAILQLAVMGKLVEQDPSDEPASKLLDQLRLARLKLYERQDQDNSEIKTMLRKLKKLDTAKAPFQLPETWTVAHLIDCCEYLVDCHNKTATYTNSGIPIVRTTNIRDRQIRYQDMKYVNEDTYTFWARRCPPKPGDIIFTREAPMGEAAIIPKEMICCLGQRTMLLRPMKEFISNQYLLLALTEPNLLERASSYAIGSTVKHLRVGDVENLSIPIPPLSEQHRIVAKVDQLMALCDTLEHHIDQATQKQTALLNALTANHAKIHNHHS